MSFSSSHSQALPAAPRISTCRTTGFASPGTPDTTPAAYARRLLDSLDLTRIPLAADDRRSAAALWADSGAMWLSGHADGSPRFCPAPLAACAQGAWLALASITAKFDPAFAAHRLLGERAAIAGLARQGQRSAGGACRLFRVADGFIALNLARPDDWDLLPAWLEQPVENDAELQAGLARADTATLLERGRLLGLALAPVAAPGVEQAHWFYATRLAPSVAPPARQPMVIDLTSLWAGPLCASLLAQAGARVIKVESSKRPDGARFGPADFFHLMNAGKESVALDLTSAEGRAQLRALLAHADIVLEAARPRGLEQMGIVAADCVRARPGMTWLSITGYGRREPMREWIAYGDDAGVAAGLSWLMGGEQQDPVFCSDAIADPLTGLHAALLALAGWQSGGGQLLDISLRGVIAQGIALGRCEKDEGLVAAPPQARAVIGHAPALGQDTDRILRQLL